MVYSNCSINKIELAIRARFVLWSVKSQKKDKKFFLNKSNNPESILLEFLYNAFFFLNFESPCNGIFIDLWRI